jgi:anti-sigma factor ChrR (cupin superfamily)
MTNMMPDGCSSAEGYALGALDPEERAEFEAHWAECISCQQAVVRDITVVAALSRDLPPLAPAPRLREHVLDLAAAPPGPIDPAAYAWTDLVPGIKVHVLREDHARNLRVCLVWGKAGAKHLRHSHRGREVLLVLQGTLKGDHGTYGAGEVYRSTAGDVHSEEVVGAEDCVCYGLYYDEL